MRRTIASLLGAALAALLLLPSAALAEEAGTVTIVHTNDSHGGYGLTTDDGDPVAYYAVVAGLAESTDADLLLDAGDTFHGASFATITRRCRLRWRRCPGMASLFAGGIGRRASVFGIAQPAEGAAPRRMTLWDLAYASAPRTSST